LSIPPFSPTDPQAFRAPARGTFCSRRKGRKTRQNLFGFGIPPSIPATTPQTGPAHRPERHCILCAAAPFRNPAPAPRSCFRASAGCKPRHSCVFLGCQSLLLYRPFSCPAAGRLSVEMLISPTVASGWFPRAFCTSRRTPPPGGFPKAACFPSRTQPPGGFPKGGPGPSLWSVRREDFQGEDPIERVLSLNVSLRTFCTSRKYVAPAGAKPSPRPPARNFPAACQALGSFKGVFRTPARGPFCSRRKGRKTRQNLFGFGIPPSIPATTPQTGPAHRPERSHILCAAAPFQNPPFAPRSCTCASAGCKPRRFCVSPPRAGFQRQLVLPAAPPRAGFQREGRSPPFGRPRRVDFQGGNPVERVPSLNVSLRTFCTSRKYVAPAGAKPYSRARRRETILAPDNSHLPNRAPPLII